MSEEDAFLAIRSHASNLNWQFSTLISAQEKTRNIGKFESTPTSTTTAETFLFFPRLLINYARSLEKSANTFATQIIFKARVRASLKCINCTGNISAARLTNWFSVSREQGALKIQTPLASFTRRAHYFMREWITQRRFQSDQVPDRCACARLIDVSINDEPGSNSSVCVPQAAVCTYICTFHLLLLRLFASEERSREKWRDGWDTVITFNEQRLHDGQTAAKWLSVTFYTQQVHDLWGSHPWCVFLCVYIFFRDKRVYVKGWVNIGFF